MLNIPQEFLQEEVREGFTVDVTMKSCWAAQLEVLREISEICERHNLQWFCAYGTLLGAVRHQGFVPWDDDMDIWMLREDYTEFLRVAKAELPEEYRVDSPLTEEGYTEYHTLVMNAGSISIRPERLQKFHGCPFATGVDVFPLDYLPRNESERETLLEMKTSKHTFLRRRLVVLHKHLRNPGLLICLIMVGLIEISSLVPKHGRSDNLQSFNFTSFNCNLAHSLVSLKFSIQHAPSRYYVQHAPIRKGAPKSTAELIISNIHIHIAFNTVYVAL